jgi:O-antigen/teichoic acid export membrane protein
MALERGGREALARAAHEQASLMLLLTVPAATGLALVAAPLSQLMVGPALAPGAAEVTPWIAASGLLAGMTTYYFHQAFTLGQRTAFLLVAMAIPAAANLALNLILIPRLGLQGALFATLASYALGLVASAALGRRLLALPVPWLSLVQAVGASSLMALAVLQVPALGGLPELAAKAALGGLVYAALIYLIDAGGLRSRAGQALRTLRARNAA